MAHTFQATIGGKFALLIGLRDKDMNINTVITTYNTAVTDAATELLGNKRHRSGKCLTEEKEILSRWTEYCSKLYNHESCGDNAVLDCSHPLEEDLQPLFHEEVEIAVVSLKKGKSARVDNIPAELVQAGRITTTDVLTEICDRIWRTGEWPPHSITLPKKSVI